MASYEVDLDLVGHILGDRPWEVLQRTLKKYEKLGNHSHERAYGFLGLECPENLYLGLFTEQTCHIISAKSGSLKGSQGCTLKALQGAL
jgi:hypothetical protein